MKKKTSIDEDETQVSSVIQLLDVVWGAKCDGGHRAWSRLNNALREALRIAIGGGFKWDLDDWKHVMQSYLTGHWIGENVEWWYSYAIASANASCIASYEHYTGRAAFIADDVDPVKCELAHSGGTRKRERLGIQFRFTFQGVRWRVNSFGPDGSYLNATEEPRPRSSEDGPPQRRLKITREMIQSDRAEKKERATLFEKLEKAAVDDKTTKLIRKALGINEKGGRKHDQDNIPTEKLREVAAKY